MDPAKLALRRLRRQEGALLKGAVDRINELLEAIDDMRHGHTNTIAEAYEKAESFLDDHGLN